MFFLSCFVAFYIPAPKGTYKDAYKWKSYSNFTALSIV